jgi:hypothetical protein
MQGKADAQLVTNAGTLANLLRSHPDGFGYAGRDARRGEKTKIVFWYRPENSRTYRAVYADLRVADVTAAQLPEDQSEQR